MSSDNVAAHTGFPRAVADPASAFLTAVYAWMCAGLAITATTAWIVAESPAIVRTIFVDPLLFWALAIAQFAIVVVLSTRVQQLAASTAAVLFVLLAAATGVTMSFVLVAFAGESVATTFLVAAGMFSGLAVYGTLTSRPLGAYQQFLFTGLLGVVLASIVGVFFRNDTFQFVLSFVGVLVFSGLVAYDSQRLKTMALQTPDGHVSSHAILGALALYLDFTNLFLFLLRFTGSRRE